MDLENTVEIEFSKLPIGTEFICGRETYKKASEERALLFKSSGMQDICAFPKAFRVHIPTTKAIDLFGDAHADGEWG